MTAVVATVSGEQTSGYAPAVAWRDVHDAGARVGSVIVVEGRLVAVCAWPCLTCLPVPAGWAPVEAAGLLVQHTRLPGHGGGGR